MNLHSRLARAVPLLLLACDKDKPSKPSADDTGTSTHDTGPAPDTVPDCDTGHLDDDGECVPAVCGTGTWGNLETDESTVYVDIAAAEGGDGSEAAPFTSIQAGLDAAGDTDGGMVAVAAGTYPETVELGRSHADVHLAGRCRELVIIDASVGDESTPGVFVDARDGAVEVSGLSLRESGYVGVLVGSGRAVLRSCNVMESEQYGVAAFRSSFYDTSVELESCELSWNKGLGVYALDDGTTVSLRETTILDTQPDKSGELGFGIQVWEGASLETEACELSGNRSAGVLAYAPGSTVTLRETIIQDTQPDGDGENGFGIEVYDGANLIAENCLITGNMTFGVHVIDAGTTATLRETIVRDTRPDESGYSGHGIEVSGGASLEAENCEISGNTVMGALVSGSGTSVVLRETIVQGNLPDQNGEKGYGIEVSGGASLEAENCELSANSAAGLIALESGTAVTLRETAILDTCPDEQEEGGYGIDVSGAILAMESCSVVGSTWAGIHATGSGTAVTLRDTTIQDTRTKESGEAGYGIQVSSGAELSAEACEVSGNAEAGVIASGSESTVSLRETTIQDTQTNEDGVVGVGILVMDGATLAAESCEVRRNKAVGVLAFGAGTSVTLTEATVEDTQTNQSGEGGYGIEVSSGASLAAEYCEVAGNTEVGIGLLGSGTSVTLRDSSIRDTQPGDQWGVGWGIAAEDGALLTAEACEVVESMAVGVGASDAGTSVRLRASSIRDTQPRESSGIGYGVLAQEGASLVAEACELEGNAVAGVIAFDSPTTVLLQDTIIRSTMRGSFYTVGMGVVAQLGATIEATDLEVCSNEGPGLYAMFQGSSLSCSGCLLQENQFAGAVVAYGASFNLVDSLIEGTMAQENIGGGIGLYAEPWGGGPPVVTVSGSTMQDNPIAGVWLSGEGSYSFSGSTIRGGAGWTRESLTKCGDAVYARDGVTAWDGTSGLLLEDNEFSDGLGAGLFLDNASATLSGSTYADNAVDLISQGSSCATPPEGYDDEVLGSAELCPIYDYATCGDEFMLVLELVDPESGYGEALLRPGFPDTGASHLPTLRVAPPYTTQPAPLLPPAPRLDFPKVRLQPLRHE